MKDKILVLDYGTTSLKAALYDGEFRALSVKSFEFFYDTPAPGFIEYDAENYITAAVKLFSEIVAEHKCGDEIAAVTVTGQAETLIPVDAAGNVLGKAMVWTDTRAQEEVAYLSSRIDARDYYEVTGISGIDPVAPLAKIRWIKLHEPERYEKTDKFLMLHDFVVWRLSGKMALETSVGSCSGYLNIRSEEYEKRFLDIAGIDENKLPPLSRADEVMGELLPEIREKTGIAGSSVVNGMLDQCASAIGAGNTEPGVVCETTGTVLAIAATLPDFKPEEFPSPVIVLRHGLRGRYLALPYCPTAGMLLKWFKDAFLQADVSLCKETGEDVFKYIDDKIAEKGAPVSKLIALPHFNGYLSPVSNPDATGVLYGLSLDTDRFDVALAIMEGVTFLLRENLELLSRSGIDCKRLISLGGGAKSRLWLGIKAAVCDLPIVTMVNEESTSLGCALGAALTLGLLKDEREIGKYVAVKKEYTADAGRTKEYQKKYEKYLDLNRRLGFWDR
ncbi:MAG: hypothetical protein IJS65_05395 [Clostridia bacterium]|nr:hypothetical protein [Clostridia bacterium]